MSMTTFNTAVAPSFSGCDYEDAVKVFTKNPEVDHFITTDDLLNLSTGSISINDNKFYLSETFLGQLAKALKYPVQNFDSEIPLVKQLEDLEYLNTLVPENKRQYVIRTIGNVAYTMYPMHKGIINPLKNIQTLEAVKVSSASDKELSESYFSFDSEGVLKVRIPKEIPVGLSGDTSYADTYIESHTMKSLGIMTGLRLKRTVCDNSTIMALGETWIESSNLVMSDVEVVRSLVDLSIENAKALPKAYEFISSDRLTPEKMSNAYEMTRRSMGTENAFNLLERFIDRDYSDKKMFKIKDGLNDNSAYDIFNDLTYVAKRLDENDQERASYLAGKIFDPYFYKSKELMTVE